PLLRYLGIVSYEWFLLHQPAQSFFRKWMGGANGSFLRYAVITLVPSLGTLAIAILLYHNFSLPIMRWGRKTVRASDVQPALVKPVALVARPPHPTDFRPAVHPAFAVNFALW